MDYINYNMDQVSCIDRQIAELEARRDALINGYCYTGYTSFKTYLDPYHLAVDSIPEVEVVEKKDEDKR